ncbi:hypothetical protein M5W83_04285 [Paenibacillus thiaminolyticus]|uniref:Uncharacterized protein n=1 Tax=Paenibacillus thiaminolyticus TaxID=49283 RepID=A0ABT4FQE4_PANTH|nr:hypothetical protein [Paenibacillus thiaminolyticus]MCY9538929.1 hypothetical protein [Paenibacillus thiaminolyticus]MCY9605325.1 hypothetical protein [Paenibacillus thiaminolyticus]MCY9606377.1 hypothetical protein [Paenibacillus thiaminolyticus]MCY9614594.1 hypothetical protein [Paenibacillus thiaminolyticus]MCY9618148.1 hypothetical protein [Paenibacillus thiaminolyticus]
MATKRKPPVIATKPQDAVNKKAIYWAGGIALVLVIIVSILLVMNG